MSKGIESTVAGASRSIGEDMVGIGGLHQGHSRVSAALFGVRLAIGRILWWFILPAHINLHCRYNLQLLADRQDELRIVDYLLSRQPSDGGR